MVPQAGGAWPVIGHLHLLGVSQPLHVTLGNMADKYGPIFSMKLGVHRALVVSNSDIAKECLTTSDKAFANRPEVVFMELLGYNNCMIGFAPYGPYWRQVRKIATLELLSSYRLEMLRHVRESTVHESLVELYQLWEKDRDGSGEAVVDMTKWFSDVIRNVITLIIVGKQAGNTRARAAQSRGWMESLKDLNELSGRFVVGDAFPYLRWLDIGGYENAMRKTAAELDRVVTKWLEEHKLRRASITDEARSDEDFMDAMLSILPDNNDTTIKATCLLILCLIKSNNFV